MPRIECPTCGTPDRADDRDLGKEWECRRCRTAYLAEPVAPPPDRPPPGADGRGAAVSSLLLGLAAVATSPCCGAGAVFGLGGWVTGFGGLQSRSRPLAVLGLLLSTVGVVVSVAVLAVFAVTATAQKDIPARPDGTQAPFARS